MRHVRFPFLSNCEILIASTGALTAVEISSSDRKREISEALSFDAFEAMFRLRE